MSALSEFLHEKISSSGMRTILVQEEVFALVRSEAEGRLHEYVAAVLGDQVLRHSVIREELGLPEKSPSPGSQDAVEECESLGLGHEYAGVKSKANFEFASYIPGESPPSPLRDYQEEVVSSLSEVISSNSRAMVSMPTGAGKTRTAVELVWDAVRSNLEASIVIWLAPTKLLCEQACQAIHHRFAAQAHDGVVLLRCWDKGAEAAERTPRLEFADGAGHTVVMVGTPQSVEKILTKLRLGQQLQNRFHAPALVVVDEAHGAVAGSISNLLRALLRWGNCPVVGLSATPFRPSKSETRELRSLFGNNLVFPSKTLGITEETEMYDALQAREVLSKFVLATKHFDPDFSVSDLRRTINDICRRKRSRCLCFCESVAVARSLDVMLRLDGLRSTCLWGECSRNVQYQAVSDFRAGRLSVLLNSDLLKEGVDLPSVTDLVLANPTTSRREFRQMMGRGARGPLSGGGAECRVHMFGGYPNDPSVSLDF